MLPPSSRPHIGRTSADSTPAFDPLPQPPDGAPNVVVIVLDDLGFAQLGCFGGDVDTPVIDGLAAGRAPLPQLPRHGAVLAHPRLRAHRPQPPRRRHGLPHRHPDRLPRLQRSHPALGRDAASPAARRRLLDLRGRQVAPRPALGAERVGSLRCAGRSASASSATTASSNGDTNQWTPELVSDNGFVEPAATPEEGYHLTEDLADRAIRFVLDQQQATPGKPFFLYFAPARCTRRTRRPSRGSSASAAATTRAGRRSGRAPSRASRTSA